MDNNPSGEDIVIVGVRLNAQYSGFTRAKVIDNERENPSLGFTVVYHGGDQGESTVYIYDKKLPEIPDGPMSQLVRQEFDQATNDVMRIRRRRVMKVIPAASSRSRRS
jgi:hypothetical protein